MKYVFILSLLIFVGLLVYVRLRPYIRTARQIFGVLRDAKRVSASRQTINQQTAEPSRRQSAGVRAAKDQRLVRCASCGTWTPTARAVSLPASQSSYCSHACLERAADAGARSRRTSIS